MYVADSDRGSPVPSKSEYICEGGFYLGIIFKTSENG